MDSVGNVSYSLSDGAGAASGTGAMVSTMWWSQSCDPLEEETLVEEEDGSNHKVETIARAQTFVVRNLPLDFCQEKCQVWLDTEGYAQCYDFLAWFPPKKNSRQARGGYFFVNFTTSSTGSTFKAKYHHFCLEPLETGNIRLNVQEAKVQGFVNNYLRYRHVGLEGSTCRPFFGETALCALSSTETEAPEDVWAVASGPISRTTVIIRSLPHHLSSNELAQLWIEKAGLSGHDFFAYHPGKHFAIVNFSQPSDAKQCISQYDEMFSGPGLSPLSVEWSTRAQGLPECLQAFSNLSSRPSLPTANSK
mmetsp:Transcript_35840/g.78471  ORF Transcript_35840/g.78471 Transcript_35840/m.78471 type:complete len:306 (-) Transcript_35840:291-1208(-)